MAKRYQELLRVVFIVVWPTFWVLHTVNPLPALRPQTETTAGSVAVDNEERRTSRGKSYRNNTSIVFKGADGELQDMGVNEQKCPFSVCGKCGISLDPSQKRNRTHWKLNNLYYGQFCVGHCDQNLRCLRKPTPGSVDCTKCKRETQIASFNPIGPVEGDDKCGGIVQWGSGDDSKFLCKTLLTNFQQNCIIVSLGGNGKWGFEEDAYAKSPCEIHTFDCTGSWAPPFAIGSRVTFHKKCIGTKELPQTSGTKAGFSAVEGNRVITYEHVVDIVGGNPDYLKADIEGAEW